MDLVKNQLKRRVSHKISSLVQYTKLNLNSYKNLINQSQELFLQKKKSFNNLVILKEFGMIK